MNASEFYKRMKECGRAEVEGWGHHLEGNSKIRGCAKSWYLKRFERQKQREAVKRKESITDLKDQLLVRENMVYFAEKKISNQIHHIERLIREYKLEETSERLVAAKKVLLSLEKEKEKQVLRKDFLIQKIDSLIAQ